MADMEDIVAKADAAIKRFKAEQSFENAEDADYRLTLMGLAFGVEKFNSLHYYAEAHRDIINFLDQKKYGALWGNNKDVEILK